MTHSLQPNLEAAAPEAASEARTQAEAYDSLFANQKVELDGGGTVSVPPHPDFGLFDDEALEKYDDLLFERDTEYEREPGTYIPEQKLRDPKTGKENGVVVPAETVPGNLKYPYRRLVDGKSVRVKPPWKIRVAQIALGDAEYKRLVDGGRGAADVWKIWGKQGLEVKERQGRSVADAGPVAVEAVPEADSE